MATDEEVRARTINAEPWQPLPDMLKLRCAGCRYWFATRDPAAVRCPDCAIKQRASRRSPDYLGLTTAEPSALTSGIRRLGQ
jgi:hypothetical protein